VNVVSQVFVTLKLTWVVFWKVISIGGAPSGSRELPIVSIKIGWVRGHLVGCTEGAEEGSADGTDVGLALGIVDGLKVGTEEGLALGYVLSDGLAEGALLG